MTTATMTYRIRQSTLRHLEEHCPAMAYALSVEGLEGPSYAGAYRGQAVHEFFSRYVERLYRVGRPTDWDAVGDVLSDVYQAYPALTLEQRSDVAAQARTIAETFLFNRETYYGTEEAFETTIELAESVEGCSTATVTGRLDYLEVEDGVARVTDVKSNHQVWPDSRVADDFQLKVYAMLVLDNLPHVEVVEGRLILSRYGIMLPQKGVAVFSREDADELRRHLSFRLAAHFAGELKGEHIPGTWCGYCPSRRVNRCLLYRTYHGTTPPPPLKEDQARKLARQIVALEDARETRIELLKQWVVENGPVALGSGDACEVFGFHKRESEEIPATALLQILEANHGLVGDQPLDDLLSLKKTTKAYKRLRYMPELRAAFEDAASVKVSTTFGHKGNSDE